MTFAYCSAWNNSDDGFDCIASSKSNTLDHCWAHNMTAGGDSNGFKIGGWGTSTVPGTVPVHTVRYCPSANNNASGFYANHLHGLSVNWTNNTSYNNHPNFNMLARVSPTDATDIPGTREVLHYNIAFTGTTISNSSLPAADQLQYKHCHGQLDSGDRIIRNHHYKRAMRGWVVFECVRKSMGNGR